MVNPRFSCVLFCRGLHEPCNSYIHVSRIISLHDDVIKWKHFSRSWPFVRGIHRSPVNSPHKGQWRGALILSLICAWINASVNNHEADDLRRHSAHYDVTLMGTRAIPWLSHGQWSSPAWYKKMSRHGTTKKRQRSANIFLISEDQVWP